MIRDAIGAIAFRALYGDGGFTMKNKTATHESPRDILDGMKRMSPI